MKQGKIVAIVFMFIMLMVTQKLIAVYPLTRTYSISPDSLHQIRAAAGLVAGETSDAFIAQYWDTYTRTYRDDIPDLGDLQRDRSYTDSFGFEPQAIKARVLLKLRRPPIPRLKQMFSSTDLRTLSKPLYISGISSKSCCSQF